MIQGAGKYLAAAVASREQGHRRLLLLGIGALTIVGTTPVFGHYLATSTQALFRGADRVGDLCLVALHELLTPVYEGFHVLFFIGLAYAIWDRTRAWRRTHGVLAILDSQLPEPGGPFEAAACTAGLPVGRLHIVDGLPNPAFTIGLLRPRVYVARELADQLSGPELGAVLAHERAHIARRDPLRLSLLRFFGCLLFWMPAVRRLAKDMMDEVEVLADDAAVGCDPLILASAIVAVAQWAQMSIERAGVVRFVSHDLIERRIRRLMGEDTSFGSHVTRRSLIGAACALALVWTSGTVVVHPLPASAHGDVGWSAGTTSMRAKIKDAESYGRHTLSGQRRAGSCVEYWEPAILLRSLAVINEIRY